MNMTSTYLLAKCKPVTPEVGKQYRVIGFLVSGAIYTVEKIEHNTAYFKGYVDGRPLNKLKFYPINN